MSYTVAILGAGSDAERHCPALRRQTLVGICDRDAGRARALAKRYDVPRIFTDLADLLAEAQPDVVHVLLPPDGRFAAAEQILRAGGHVFVEPPPALTGEECRRLEALAREAGRTVGVCHHWTFAPAYERLRAAVRAGKFGRIERVTISWKHELDQLRTGPFGGWLLSDPANVVLAFGPHTVAQMLGLVGAPGRLDVEAGRPFELSNGTKVLRDWRVKAYVGETNVELVWSFDLGPSEHVIHVRGSAGTATADLNRGRSFFGRGDPVGESVGRAIEAFYVGLPGTVDERLSASFSGRVVEFCRRIAIGASRERKRPEDQGSSNPPVACAPGSPKAPDCLVLGGTGVLGQALARRLVETGRPVRLLVTDPDELSKSLRELPLEIVGGDIANASDLDRALAGARDVFLLPDERDETAADIVAGECLGRKIRRLVYCGPVAAERPLLELHDARDLPVVILRPGIVLGMGANPFHPGVGRWPAPFVCRCRGRGNRPLPLVLADDVARALVRAAEVEGIEGETLDLVAETDITARDYVAALARVTGTPIDARPQSVFRYCVNALVRRSARLDGTKAKRLLGWRPETNRVTLLRDGVERPAIQWIQ